MALEGTLISKLDLITTEMVSFSFQDTGSAFSINIFLMSITCNISCSSKYIIAGNVTIKSGSATYGSNPYLSNKPDVPATGGSVEIFSGGSHKSHSGEISIVTADAGVKGDSGILLLQTGDATSGEGGYVGKW